MLRVDSLHARRPATGPILTIAHRTDRTTSGGNWTSGAQYCLLSCVYLMYGGALESDSWTVTLLNMTGSVVAQSCSGVGFVITDVQSCSRSIEEA